MFNNVESLAKKLLKRMEEVTVEDPMEVESDEEMVAGEEEELSVVENSADEQGPNSYIIPDRYILRTKRVVSPQPKILDGWDGVSILDRKFFLYESCWWHSTFRKSRN